MANIFSILLLALAVQCGSATSTGAAHASTIAPSKAECPPGGVWSEWATGPCETTCGSYTKVNRTRICTTRCGDCPCEGAASDIGPCGIALCPFPNPTCRTGYIKHLNYDTGYFFCGTSSVPQVVCSSTTIAPTSPPPTTTTIPSPTTTANCPSGGVWSEWFATDRCPTKCGAYTNITRVRYCTDRCGDCPCVGPYSDNGPCGLNLCTFPNKSCRDGYKKHLNNNTGALFCGTADVPVVTCP